MKQHLRVLSIEDQRADVELINAYLAVDEFEPHLKVVQTAEEMKLALSAEQWDVILADYSLPRFSASAALQLLRESNLDIPFIVVSGTIGETRAIEMMRAGAQDFILKGDFTRLLPAIKREVTEARNRAARRQIESALSSSELRFRELADAMPQLVWITKNGRISYVNLKWVDYFGTPVTGDDWVANFVHPDDVATTRELGAKAFAQKTPLEIEFRLRRADGVYRWFLSRGMVSTSEAGDEYWFGTCTDIEDSKRESEKQRFLLRAGGLLSSSLDYEVTLKNLASLVVEDLADWCSIAMIGDDGRPTTLTVNHRDPSKVEYAKELKRRFPDNWDAPTGAPNVLRTGKPELYPEIPDTLLKVVSRSEEEYRIAKELGLRSAMIVPLTNSSGTVGAISFISADRDRRYSEADLQFAMELAKRASLAVENASLYRKAEKASRAKTEFLANMSHEIRTPLGAVLGFAELLQDPNQSEKDRRDCVSVILRNGKQLAKLINEILDLTKIESGRLELERSEFALTEVIEEVTTLLNVQAQAKGVLLKVNFGKSLPERIISDPTRVRQVLINLIGNAIKFTASGEVGLLVELRPNSVISFLVSDTGIGMTESHASKLFEPFVQGDSSMTRKFGGTGLGLALSRNLAQALSGDLVLRETKLGKGTTFEFTFGFEPAASNSSLNISSDKMSEFDQELDLAGRKVLVVDDSPDNRVLITRYLTKAGAEVDSASDGATGADRALEYSYAAVLMDLQMPGVDGFEALRLLKSKGYNRPVIALTAHAMAGDREKCLSAGFDEHLSKPIDSRKLIETLKSLSENI